MAFLGSKTVEWLEDASKLFFRHADSLVLDCDLELLRVIDDVSEYLGTDLDFSCSLELNGVGEEIQKNLL